jgi:Bacterial CdiA-CT RNAse A domain
LLFLCPPAATACLTAATVLAAAQVTVDTTRRARGEHLSAEYLGLEMAAAIPLGGNAVRGLRGTRGVTHLVPGGGLMAHEGLDGGHTLAKHVGKTEAFLRNRLATEPHIDAASTFYNREVAEESLSTVLYDNKRRIATWLSTPTKELILSGRAAEPVGVMTVRESSTVQEANGIRLVLRQSSRLAIGYRIHTAMVTM